MFTDGVGGLAVYGSATPELANALNQQIAVLWQQGQ
jgi:hypothetical protein